MKAVSQSIAEPITGTLVSVLAKTTLELSPAFRDAHPEIPAGNRTVLILTALDSNLKPFQAILGYGCKSKRRFEDAIGQIIEFEPRGRAPVVPGQVGLFEGVSE